MSKYLALDIGQVIYDVDLDSFIKELKCTMQYSVGSYLAEEFILTLAAPQDIGTTTIRAALKNTYLFSDRDKELVRLEKKWNSIITPNQEIMTFIDYLERKGVKIALLSNIGKTHARLIGEKFPETYENKILHLSCEVGARKPNKLFYQSFLLDHPEFKGCLYLDDRQENIEMGMKYGFNPYRFTLEKFNNLGPEQKKIQLNNIKALLGIL